MKLINSVALRGNKTVIEEKEEEKKNEWRYHYEEVKGRKVRREESIREYPEIILHHTTIQVDVTQYLRTFSRFHWQINPFTTGRHFFLIIPLIIHRLYTPSETQVRTKTLHNNFQLLMQHDKTKTHCAEFIYTPILYTSRSSVTFSDPPTPSQILLKPPDPSRTFISPLDYYLYPL